MHFYGDYRIKVKDGVMYVKASGIFNEPLATKYIAEFMMYANQLKFKPWCLLGDGREWEATTPEVVDAFKATAIWTDKNNMKRLALLMKDSPLSILELHKVVGQHHEITEVKHFFDLEEEIAWITEAGFSVDRDLCETVFAPLSTS